MFVFVVLLNFIVVDKTTEDISSQIWKLWINFESSERKQHHNNCSNQRCFYEWNIKQFHLPFFLELIAKQGLKRGIMKSVLESCVRAVILTHVFSPSLLCCSAFSEKQLLLWKVEVTKHYPGFFCTHNHVIQFFLLSFAKIQSLGLQNLRTKHSMGLQ